MYFTPPRDHPCHPIHLYHHSATSEVGFYVVNKISRDGWSSDRISIKSGVGKDFAKRWIQWFMQKIRKVQMQWSENREIQKECAEDIRGTMIKWLYNMIYDVIWNDMDFRSRLIFWRKQQWQRCKPSVVFSSETGRCPSRLFDDVIIWFKSTCAWKSVSLGTSSNHPVTESICYGQKLSNGSSEWGAFACLILFWLRKVCRKSWFWNFAPKIWRQHCGFENFSKK